MRTHLVSGVTSGIGQAYADKVRTAGENLIAMVRNEKQISDVPATHHIIYDYAYPERLPQVFKTLPYVDVFVSAAGILNGKAYTEVSAADAFENLTVNLLSPMLLAQHVAPKLNSAGVMIFLGSISGHKGSYDDGYAAAKGGIHSFVKSIALKLALENKRVIAIAPGITEHTRMTDIRSKAELQTVLAQIPLKRFSTPKEIADWIWFCASPAAKSMTGTIVDINGGQYLR